MLTMKDIRQEGDPVLRKRASEVTLPLSQEDLTILRDMMNYITTSQDDELAEEFGLRPAVGLAAPQIGIPKKMFCMFTADETGETLHAYAVVNPKIIASSEEMTYLPGGEGCLSVDEEKNGLVPRAARIKAKAHLVDLEKGEGRDVLLKLSGYPGIVFQHEYDHLLGVLFVDKKKESLEGLKPVVFVESETMAE